MTLYTTVQLHMQRMFTNSKLEHFIPSRYCVLLVYLLPYCDSLHTERGVSVQQVSQGLEWAPGLLCTEGPNQTLTKRIRINGTIAVFKQAPVSA